MTGQKVIWIAVAEVRPGEYCSMSFLDGEGGAHVVVLAKARNKAEFTRTVIDELDEDDVELVKLKHLRPFVEERDKPQFGEHELEGLEYVKRGGKVGFGDFHTFPEVDEEEVVH